MNCHNMNLERFIDFGHQPSGNFFPSLEETESEEVFPFAMLVCTDCWQVQIEEFPSTEVTFTNHPYVTGINKPVVSHFEKLVERIIEKFAITKNSLVLDIGCNDGTLLSKFRDCGMQVIGIDPNIRTGEIAREKGITVFKKFWSSITAEALSALDVTPDLITATAVFYHIEDIHDFVQGLDLIMGAETVFCTQCVYLKDVIEKNQFDHFYHEHTLIHSIYPLKRLFSQYNLRLVDVDYYPIHGGSFVLYVVREESRFLSSGRINNAIAEEKRIGLNELQTYRDFTKNVEYNKKILISLLNQINDSGKKVFGLGAPLKGSTLLNYSNIGPELVSCIIEINDFKIGRYTPGTHIPIFAEHEQAEQPDYYLILSWNYLSFFTEKYAEYLDNGGKFIVPHPNVKVIDKDSL